MYAYAHNSQPLSEHIVSPHEIVFHTQPRIPLTFDLNLNRNASKLCVSEFCSQYQDTLSMTKQIKIFSFIELLQNLFHNGSSP